MRKRKTGIALLTATSVLGCALLSQGCASDEANMDFTVNYDGIKTVSTTADAAVHDPSILAVDGTYYIFGSHMSAAQSIDLQTWDMLTAGYTPNNKVYTDIINYDSGEFAFTGSKSSIVPTDDGTFHVWAPCVIYNKAQGLYYMYYCTSSTFNASTLCFGTSENPEGPYEWKGNLIYSGVTVNNIAETDILDYVDQETAVAKYTTKAGYEYNYEEYPNAIDPTVFYDEDGRMWMVYGSWSGGIFLLEIDEQTGLVIHPEADEANDVDPYYGKRLLGGGHQSIEGPWIEYDEEAGYYYLYVSYGELTREGGYQIRVFRSKTVDGDYVDMNGASPDESTAHEYYGLKLSGNYYLPSLEVAYMATGHNSALIDDDGKRYIVYHTRFDNGSEMHTPKVKQYFLNEEGWPCMLPYTTRDETISEDGYSKDEIVGRYYVVNQGTDISSEIDEPIILYLNKDGSVTGEEVEGTWSASDGSYYMKITYDDKEYSGVFCAMKDEAGTDVFTFSAVGSNESVWGVKYE